MKKTHKLFNLLSIILVLVVTLAGSRAQSNPAFKSYAAGFSISLPSKIKGSGGNGTAGGVNFVWRESEADYEIGFMEKLGLPFALDGENFSFEACLKRYFNEFSERGEKIGEREVSLGTYQGKEYKYKTKDTYYILRLFEVGNRIYKILAKIPLKQPLPEEKVFRVFDSFQLIDKSAIRTEMKRKLDEATPKPLPQAPVLPKLKNDLDDKGLKGKVKSVLTGTAYFNLKDSLKPFLPTLFEEFNEHGNLLKTIEYNSYGDPSTVKGYGYVAGKRVARLGSIKYEYDFLGGIPISLGEAKFDDRFDESFSYKYLNDSLVEERKYFSNGVPQYRAVFRHLKDKKETDHYSMGETIPYLKVEEFLDPKGNSIKLIYKEMEGKRFVPKDSFTIKYESFDEQGNWTRRVISKDYGFGSVVNFVPEYVEVREIFYFE